MAGGLADDLATTLLLATDKRTLVAPAMNVRMWLHPATRRNVARLKADGVLFVGPETGPMACGEFGPGRMAEPPAIIEAIEPALAADVRWPVRAASGRGPLSGPACHCHLGPDLRADRPGPLHRQPLFRPTGTCNCASRHRRRRKGDAGHRAGLRCPIPPARPSFMSSRRAKCRRRSRRRCPPTPLSRAAAVADWRVETCRQREDQERRSWAADAPPGRKPRHPCGSRNKKPYGRPSWLDLPPRRRTLTANASAKLQRKSCDLIVANSVAEGTPTFGGEANEVQLMTRTGWSRGRQ